MAVLGKDMTIEHLDPQGVVPSSNKPTTTDPVIVPITRAPIPV